MRSIRIFSVSVGLGVLLTCGWAAAQDAAKPAVQVVIGADGSVKVIDPQTGQELPSVVTKVAPKAPVRLEAQFELEFAGGALVQALVQAEKAAKNKKADAKGEPRGLEFDFFPSAGGQPKIIVIQRGPRPAEKPATLDQKVDRLLQEMADLRRDVNQLKGKLDGKSWPGGPWMFGPFGPKDGKDKKPGVTPPPPPAGKEFKFRIEFDNPPKKPVAPQPPQPPAGKELEFKFMFEFDKATKKQLEEMLKKLQAEASKKPGRKQEPPKAADRNAEVDRILERMVREVEELRQEIRKSKGAPK